MDSISACLMLLQWFITEENIDDASGVGDNCGALFSSGQGVGSGAPVRELVLDGRTGHLSALAGGRQGAEAEMQVGG